MIKAVIFDFGGVFNIDDGIGEFWVKNKDKFKVDPDKLDKLASPIWDDARVGKIDSNLFWSEPAKLIGIEPEELKKSFMEYTGFRDELYDYVKNNLQGKFKLAILSNQIDTWLEPILEVKDFKSIFDAIVTSYNFGVAKPDIKIYQEVVRQLNVEAEECVYIEDVPKNLEPAKKLGMKVIQFKNFEQFKEELENII